MVKKGVSIPETTKSDSEVIEELNNRIAKLRWYGMRDVPVEKPSYLLSWSNGSKSWLIYRGYGVIQPGTTIQLDVNQFLAPYRMAVLERIIGKLDYLPL